MTLRDRPPRIPRNGHQGRRQETTAPDAAQRYTDGATLGPAGATNTRSRSFSPTAAWAMKNLSLRAGGKQSDGQATRASPALGAAPPNVRRKIGPLGLGWFAAAANAAVPTTLSYAELNPRTWADGSCSDCRESVDPWIIGQSHTPDALATTSVAITSSARVAVGMKQTVAGNNTRGDARAANWCRKPPPNDPRGEYDEGAPPAERYDCARN